MRALIVSDRRRPGEGEMWRLLEGAKQVSVVAAAADAPGAVGLIRRTRPDVVLVDAAAVSFDGIAVTRTIMQETGHARTRVLLFGAPDDQRRLAEALRAGATGLLAPGADAKEVVSAARAVALGHIVVALRAGRPVLAELAERGQLGSDQRLVALDRLTRREREVFELLAEGKDTRQIAGILVVGENTVRTHVKHVYTKLRLRGHIELLIFAHDHGIPAARREP